jgi:hypothetical protein
MSIVFGGVTRHGSSHKRLNYNNQDALLSQQFTVPKTGKTYHVGLVSDGCSGNPNFSHNEVGSNLLVLYAYRRIQEYVSSGMNTKDIPNCLFQSITDFLLTLMNLIIPNNFVWEYPFKSPKLNSSNSRNRFRDEYLAATFLGFISDGEVVVTFSAGDGIILVNEEVLIIEQNDRPDYPVLSINNPVNGFVVNEYDYVKINRIAVMTDGLKGLLSQDGFVDSIFSESKKGPMGLGVLMANKSDLYPDLMKDDCTIVALGKYSETVD